MNGVETFGNYLAAAKYTRGFAYESRVETRSHSGQAIDYGGLKVLDEAHSRTAVARDPDGTEVVAGGTSRSGWEAYSICGDERSILRHRIGALPFGSALAVSAVPGRRLTGKTDVGQALNSIFVSSRQGDLRSTYKESFRLLNDLFATGRLGEGQTALQILCSTQFPIGVGVGALRFTSSAANRIPAWSGLVAELKRRARKEGLDPSEALRGL